MPQGARDDRGTHQFSAPLQLEPFVTHRSIGMLNEALQQADQRSSSWSEGESLCHHDDCLRGCDVPKVQAANAVSNHKHPAMRPGFLSRPWYEGRHCIFIVRTKLAGVACLPESYVQHEISSPRRICQKEYASSFAIETIDTRRSVYPPLRHGLRIALTNWPSQIDVTAPRQKSCLHRVSLKSSTFTCLDLIKVRFWRG